MGKAYVINTWGSPYAVLKPIAISDVRIKDSFWAPRLKTWMEITLPMQYDKLEEMDRINRFRWASGKIYKKPEKSIHPFDDSDVYKWLEACAYALALFPEIKGLRSLVDDIISEVVSAQEEDGYLFTEYRVKRDSRWTKMALAHAHELYCAGHLIQAAIALHRSIGSRILLDAAEKFADLITQEFGPSKLQGIDGHPEIEMALVELYRETGKRRYLDTAIFFLEERGMKEHLRPEEKEHLIIYNLLGGAEFYIDHKPYKELNEITGHAVAALYLNCGATDIYLETGEREIFETLVRLWNDMVNYKMYITGGVGSRHVSESFGGKFELPNERSYAETCAAIANFMWNWRMLLATGEARFADLMELTLYNAILAGISLDGTRYFYFNPLADRGETRRQDWFSCACCPPNLLRLLLSIPGYFYCISQRGVWVNFYATSEAEISYNGLIIQINQKTEYPWSGDVKLEINPMKEEEFSIFLRVPDWCEGAKIILGNKTIVSKSSRYVEVRKVWHQGDALKVIFKMPIRSIVSHPHVSNNFARIALKRGPIVYCLEQIDNPEADVWNIMIANLSKLTSKYEPKLLGGIMTISGEGMAFNQMVWRNKLYTPLERLNMKNKRIRIKAIPYYAWGNREPGPMITWIPCTDLMRSITKKG